MQLPLPSDPFPFCVTFASLSPLATCSRCCNNRHKPSYSGALVCRSSSKGHSHVFAAILFKRRPCGPRHPFHRNWCLLLGFFGHVRTVAYQCVRNTRFLAYYRTHVRRRVSLPCCVPSEKLAQLLRGPSRYTLVAPYDRIRPPRRAPDAVQLYYLHLLHQCRDRHRPREARTRSSSSSIYASPCAVSPAFARLLACFSPLRVSF